MSGVASAVALIERSRPVAWDPGSADGGGPERLADDFGSYALRQCTRALTSGG